MGYQASKHKLKLISSSEFNVFQVVLIRKDDFQSKTPHIWMILGGIYIILICTCIFDQIFQRIWAKNPTNLKYVQIVMNKNSTISLCVTANVTIVTIAIQSEDYSEVVLSGF